MNTPYKMDRRTKKYKWTETKPHYFQLYEFYNGRYISIEVFKYRKCAQRYRDDLARNNPDKKFMIIAKWD